MKKFLLALGSLFLVLFSHSQQISIRVRQTSFSAVDPDGAGPATGVATFRFELKSSGADVLADGIGLSVVYQSSSLTPTPTNSTAPIGPINNALWALQVNNRLGNTITPVIYNGKSFDKRIIITFNQSMGVPDALISGTSWTPVAQVSYYTLGSANPQGGYIVPEPGATVAQNELSSDGGLSTYPYLSPELTTPLPLGSGALPITLTKFDAQCQPNKATSVTWTTAQEINNNYFEVERSSDAITWSSLSKVNASGNSSVQKNYQITDALSGAAFYRLKQVDIDGKISYSSIVKTTCEGRGLFVNLYPVPARDVVNLIVGSDKAIKTNLQVFDNNGRLVINKPVSISSGINNFSLQLQHLAAGDYLIRSSDSGIEINKRFTVIR